MITGRTVVAGVAGSPVAHSLSPILHNAWLAASGIDGVYVAFPVAADGFARFVEGLRGGAVRGLNVTVPFKETALASADRATDRARQAGAANVLTFESDGTVSADNTDGAGLLAAFAEQAPTFDLAAAPVALFGAGGAARGAVATLLAAGAPQVRLINRTPARAEALAADFGERVTVWDGRAGALEAVGAIINATSAELGGDTLAVAFGTAPPSAVAMDMTYKPLLTPFLAKARAQRLHTVDGLAMLIGQARPSFEAFFGQPPPADVDVRALALKALGA